MLTANNQYQTQIFNFLCHSEIRNSWWIIQQIFHFQSATFHHKIVICLELKDVKSLECMWHIFPQWKHILNNVLMFFLLLMVDLKMNLSSNYKLIIKTFHQNVLITYFLWIGMKCLIIFKHFILRTEILSFFNIANIKHKSHSVSENSINMVQRNIIILIFLGN